jgi:hypothetical protein
MNAISPLALIHTIVREHLKTGGAAIDATAGRGYDTAFLAEIVGERGDVLAMDIQPQAIESTRALLAERGLSAQVVEDSHANMARYRAPSSQDCIMFNLGYLPKGDHSVFTHFESTRAAIMAGLSLLRVGGLMTIGIYYGGDSGYEERDALLPFLERLDNEKYQVVMARFYNWAGDPPIPVFIRKLS